MKPEWQPMDSAPKDGTVIEACCRYRTATAGAPAFVAFMQGEWRELGRDLMEPMVCWAWRPRTSWPDEDWVPNAAPSPVFSEEDLEAAARAHYEQQTQVHPHEVFIRWAKWDDACKSGGWRTEKLAAMRAALIALNLGPSNG